MNVTGFINGVAFFLVFIGALSWGLVGAFDYNIVIQLFGDGTTATTVIYVAIGVAALYTGYVHCTCGKSGKSGK